MFLAINVTLAQQYTAIMDSTAHSRCIYNNVDNYNAKPLLASIALTMYMMTMFFMQKYLKCDFTTFFYK